MKYFFCLALVLPLLACGDSRDLGRQVTPEDFRGRWLVINYWAQWCTPCIKEIPELNSLDKLPDVTVLGVNYDGATGEELAQQRRMLGVEFASLESDPAAQLGTARPVVLPTTLILDPQGNITATLVGPQTLDSLSRVTGQVGDDISR